MLEVFQAAVRESFLVSQSFLVDVSFFKWEAPVAGIRLSLSKATVAGPSFSAGILGVACLVLLPSPCSDSGLCLSFSRVCGATSVTRTRRICRNLLRREAGFVCYTSSVLRGGRHVKQKGRIYALLLGSGLKVAKVEDCKGFLQKFGIAEVEDCRSLAQLRPFH